MYPPVRLSNSHYQGQEPYLAQVLSSLPNFTLRLVTSGCAYKGLSNARSKFEGSHDLTRVQEVFLCVKVGCVNSWHHLLQTAFIDFLHKSVVCSSYLKLQRVYFAYKPMASTQPAASEPYPSFINRRRYINAFMKVSPNTGSTFYPCSENDIKALTNDDFQRFDSPILGGLILGGLMSMEEATVQLERFLLPSNPVPKSATNALQRLRNMLTWENHELGPDLVVKSCYDWDKVFFNKRLKGHVTIRWKSQEAMEAMTTALNSGVNGQCVNNDISWRWGHCQVELNADTLLLLPGAMEPPGWRSARIRFPVPVGSRAA